MTKSGFVNFLLKKVSYVSVILVRVQSQQSVDFIFTNAMLGSFAIHMQQFDPIFSILSVNEMILIHDE